MGPFLLYFVKQVILVDMVDMITLVVSHNDQKRFAFFVSFGRKIEDVFIPVIM